LQDASEALLDKKVELWPEHKLKALLATAEKGKYYKLDFSRATAKPEFIVGALDIAPDTDPQTAIFRG
jgi:hypothetical protein